jgi:hypothetical protein
MDIPVDKAGLTFAQHEALALVSEECGAAVQECGKIFRHGLIATDYAVEPPVRYDNGGRLLRCMADIVVAVNLASRVGLVADLEAVDAEMQKHIAAKLQNLRKRVHAPELLAAMDDMIEEEEGVQDGTV